MAASRSNKPFVAEEVVRIWRKLDPPGRFLVRTDPSLGDDSTWHDVGDKRARKKASQALREKERADDMLHQHHRQGAAATHPHAEATAGCTGHIPAMAAAPGVSLVSPMAVMPNNQQSNFAAAVTAMATAAAAANEQSRKRPRETESSSSVALEPQRMIAAQHDVSQSQPSSEALPTGLDSQAVTHALGQLLQQARGSAHITTSSIPDGGVDIANLLPILQLLVQQKQQQQEEQERQQREALQRQQVVSALINVVQSLSGGAAALTGAPEATGASASLGSSTLPQRAASVCSATDSSLNAATAFGSFQQQSSTPSELDQLLAAQLLAGLLKAASGAGTTAPAASSVPFANPGHSSEGNMP